MIWKRGGEIDDVEERAKNWVCSQARQDRISPTNQSSRRGPELLIQTSSTRRAQMQEGNGCCGGSLESSLLSDSVSQISRKQDDQLSVGIGGYWRLRREKVVWRKPVYMHRLDRNLDRTKEWNCARLIFFNKCALLVSCKLKKQQ